MAKIPVLLRVEFMVVFDTALATFPVSGIVHLPVMANPKVASLDSSLIYRPPDSSISHLKPASSACASYTVNKGLFEHSGKRNLQLWPIL
jgi:hypothetical protein